MTLADWARRQATTTAATAAREQGEGGEIAAPTARGSKLKISTARRPSWRPPARQQGSDGSLSGHHHRPGQRRHGHAGRPRWLVARRLRLPRRHLPPAPAPAPRLRARTGSRPRLLRHSAPAPAPAPAPHPRLRHGTRARSRHPRPQLRRLGPATMCPCGWSRRTGTARLRPRGRRERPHRHTPHWLPRPRAQRRGRAALTAAALQSADEQRGFR